MLKLLTLSRAARLVGQSRGTLQKQVQNGGLTSFEGKVSLAELTQLYPQAHVEDNTMLEKVEEIIERARFKARNRPPVSLDRETLTARVSLLSDELAQARQEIGDHAILMDKLKSRLKTMQTNVGDETREVLLQLQQWLTEQAAHTSNLTPSQRQLMARDTILRIIAAQVHINPSGHEFLVEGNNTLLESGLSSGFALDYGCSNGNCGMCKAKLISGEVKKVRQHDYVLTEAEKAQNTILMCCHTALTDLVLEAEEAGASQDIPVQTIAARIKKVEPVTEIISILYIRMPRTQRLRFLAGQRVRLNSESGNTIVLPIASCPCDEMNLQFHIDSTNTNPFIQEVTASLKTGDPIEVVGPEGEFILHEDPPNPILFLAMDTGFAPIKSLIEHAMTLDVAESLHLYWFTSTIKPPYLDNLCRAWDDAFDSFSYQTIHCGQSANTNENVCQQHFARIASKHPELARYQLYIAGPEIFIEQARLFCSQQAMPEQYISVERV